MGIPEQYEQFRRHALRHMFAEVARLPTRSTHNSLKAKRVAPYKLYLASLLLFQTYWC